LKEREKKRKRKRKNWSTKVHFLLHFCFKENRGDIWARSAARAWIRASSDPRLSSDRKRGRKKERGEKANSLNEEPFNHAFLGGNNIFL
jgi:hypothetical protein